MIETLLALAEKILLAVKEFDAAGIIALIKDAFATLFPGKDTE